MTALADNTLDVTGFIIHRLSKAQYEEPILQLRDSCVPIDQPVESFTKDAASMFERQKSGQVYAAFNPDMETYRFAAYLRDYVENQMDFLTFSTRSAHLLEARMKAATASTGGFLIFLDFKFETNRTVLVLLLNHKGAYAVDEETLTLKEAVHLNMDKIDIAARIDVTSWLVDGEDPLSIVGGKKRVSEYFQDFVGADQRKTAKQTTKTLAVLVESWMDEKGFSPSERVQVQTSLAEIFKQRHKAGEPVSLMDVAAIVAKGESEAFFMRANSEEKISSEFPVDPDAVRHWVRVEHKGKDLVISFSRTLADQKKITYDDEENLLVIHDIPDDLRDQMRKLRNSMTPDEPAGSHSDS